MKKEDHVSISFPFLAKYLPSAPAEYLKVYLAYEFLKSSGGEITEEIIADFLQTTEGRVKKALTFWSEEGLILSESSEPSAKSAENGSSPSIVPEMIVFAEIYMGRDLTTKEISIFNDIEKTCQFDASLFHYLFDYCINRKKKKFTYMKKVAETWKEKNIHTVEEAKYYVNRYSVFTSEVSKIFGITNRMLGKAEVKYIEAWIEKKIPRELILEACQRTILHTGKGSFPYADKILSDWILQGVKDLYDLKKIDEKHKESLEDKKSTKAEKKPRNKFHEFDQRSDYDWDALEEALHNR